MFLDAWGSIYLFGLARLRRRRWATGLLLLTPSVLVSIAVIGFWGYAVVDHRPHRTLRVSFSDPVTALPTDDASCSDHTKYGLGRQCLSTRAIYQLHVALPDGLTIQDASDEITWTTDAANRLVAFEFRSRARFNGAEARSFVEREAARLGDGSSVHGALEWIRACDTRASRGCTPPYRIVCLRDSPMRVCLTLTAPAPGGGPFSVRYRAEYP